MNKQLFIGQNISQNTKSNALSLVNGEAGIFGINSATYTDEKVASPGIYERVFIGMGTATLGRPNLSRDIVIPQKVKNFQYKKFNYSAPVAKLFLVSTDCILGSSYDDVVIRVASRFGEDFSGKEQDHKTYHATGNFATSRAVYDEWERIIQADPFSNLVVNATDAGLEIQGADPDQVLDIAVEYYDNPSKPQCATCSECDSTIAVMNEGDSGSGTLKHMLSLAREAGPYLGAAWYNDRNLVNPGADLEAKVRALGNADLIYIKWANTDQAGGDHGQVFDIWQELFLAFPTGTNTGALEAVLDYVLNSTIKTSLAS